MLPRLLHSCFLLVAMFVRHCVGSIETGEIRDFSRSKPKHILFFVIDDYGFSDASYKADMYNGTAPPPTPAIDKLALEGVRLESHYVNKLCSPTRTALLSGRYAYTNGMDDGVIIDGQDIDLPLNELLISDYLQQAGWKTSAYGKWDAGMTTWGSTPTCRGFDHFNGFYSAASDYFTHMVGPGFDYHSDFDVDDNASGTYTTHKVTTAVQNWIKDQVSKRRDGDDLKTFAYVAHEAVHGPLEVPLSYINEECKKLIPEDYPIRRIYCGMVRAMDESVANITFTYKSLGLWNETLVILTGDNGGIPTDGGNNFPLRGNKATVWEGGVRSMAFISGAGVANAGSISHELMHVTDWLPTIVEGIAGIDLPSGSAHGRSCPTCTRPLMPLDGKNQWPMLSESGVPSSRNEVLLDLQATACNRDSSICAVPGSGAIRVGKWKLIHGHAGVWSGDAAICSARQMGKLPSKSTLPVSANETNPWCPWGWTPPPRADGLYMEPILPPDAKTWPNCSSLPCTPPHDAGYVIGTTLLFDVVQDMFEHHDVASQNPDVVKELLSKLQAYNNSHCGGQRCLPDNAGGARGEPTKRKAPLPPAWLPWRGNSTPSTCDTNRTAPPDPSSSLHSSFRVGITSLRPPLIHVTGWAFDTDWQGGGIPPMTVILKVDGEAVRDGIVANITRSELPQKTGAPNAEHGFDLNLEGSAAQKLTDPTAAVHRLDLDVYLDPSASGKTVSIHGSPACFARGGKSVSCPKAATDYYDW